MPTYTVGQPDNFNWGMGSYLRDAESATGQTSSSKDWAEISASILQGHPVADEPKAARKPIILKRVDKR